MTEALLLKLQPNQDVVAALEAAVAATGMSRARIAAAVGSLVEGVVHDGHGIRLVEGPAIEVAALTGVIDPAAGSRLHGYFCRQDTRTTAGELVRGHNAVGVTFEVLLEDCGAR